MAQLFDRWGLIKDVPGDWVRIDDSYSVLMILTVSFRSDPNVVPMKINSAAFAQRVNF